MTLLFYVFASFGAAFVLGYSKITLPFRSWLSTYEKTEQIHRDNEWVKNPLVLRLAARWLLALLECPACVAFWLGLLSVFTPIVDFVPFNLSGFPLALALGFANLGANLTLGMLTGLIRTE